MESDEVFEASRAPGGAARSRSAKRRCLIARSSTIASMMMSASATAARICGSARIRSCSAGCVYDTTRALGVVGADPIPAPAQQPLHVVRVVDGPRDDAGADAVHRFYERLVQRRALLPERLRRRV